MSITRPSLTFDIYVLCERIKELNSSNTLATNSRFLEIDKSAVNALVFAVAGVKDR